jgi:preprotein translocase subunit SecA
MRIPYISIINLLKTEYTVITKQEFLLKYLDLINKSSNTAELIEDYEYLSVMTGENDKYDNFVVVYKEGFEGTHLPFILENGNDLTLMGLAKLSCDTPIKKEPFYKLIEKEARKQDMEPSSLLLQFDMCVEKIEEIREKAVKKIQRNDPCPCGSGKKYKVCHGIRMN